MDDNGVRDDSIPWTMVRDCFLRSHLWVVIIFAVVLLWQLGPWQEASENGEESQGQATNAASKAPPVQAAASMPVHQTSSGSPQERKGEQRVQIDYGMLREVHRSLGTVMCDYVKVFSNGGTPAELELAGTAIMATLKKVKCVPSMPRDYMDSVEDLFAFLTELHRQRSAMSRYTNDYRREQEGQRLMIELLRRMERFSKVREKYGLPDWK